MDKVLGKVYGELDKKVGRGNYVVALSAAHGVVPIPEDMQKTGADSGALHLPEVQERVEIALESLNYPKPTVARINGSDVYFAPDVYRKLQADLNAMSYVLVAIGTAPRLAPVYPPEELRDP